MSTNNFLPVDRTLYKIFDDGYEGYPYRKNPYLTGSIEYEWFERGYTQAEDDAFSLVDDMWDTDTSDRDFDYYD